MKELQGREYFSYLFSEDLNLYKVKNLHVSVIHQPNMKKKIQTSIRKNVLPSL